ncbi:hypoxanthine phosphoribosyltransferase [Fructilactobacillus sanfranciscensis]|uniref:hypoxanthine phosphoribosyltransferase n=1 Tax=Fructilactobacillus sanfranciscensis TaxID=1625 RepID=UPI0013CF7785|nr:hypoxanthine phosphoribosyltransferase [Fructilactobacillus sanfranciscensis]NDR60145.1 hypoxanthine phosphoribosyltransferase [Fructilactobacillus sanfranciscensis]
MNDDIQKVLYSEAKIQDTCVELGKQLTKDYQGKTPLVVCVLKGAVPFMADVIKRMNIYMDLDFIDVSSYKGGTVSTGEVELVKDLVSDVKDRDVLFIDDIIDTGRTLDYLKKILKNRGAKSVKVCTLMDKPEARKVDTVQADYVGFDVPNEFLVGYGLDYQGKYRNLPYVGVLKPEVYKA